MLLSIVIPCHNSHARSRRLVSTLQLLEADDIEVIFVDDGGKPEEYELLKDDAASMAVSAKVVRQKNRGPGGARNQGLSRARGEYVWFVDSDDDIKPEAISVLRENRGYDFVDFDALLKGVPTSTMPFERGPHNIGDRAELIRGFGRLWTKMFSRSFLLENRLFYPENCYFEDNAFAMYAPMAVRSFYRSDTVGYVHSLEFESITRAGGLSPRYFDRLDTAEYGLKRGLAFGPSKQERKALLGQFCKFFYRVTILAIRKHGGNPLMTQRVMRRFKDVMAEYDPALAEDQMPVIFAAMDDPEEQAVYQLLWDNSGALSDPVDFFNQLRMSSWKREIVYRDAPLQSADQAASKSRISA